MPWVSPQAVIVAFLVMGYRESVVTNSATDLSVIWLDCVKFKDFIKTFLLFSKTENLRKILIYM